MGTSGEASCAWRKEQNPLPPLGRATISFLDGVKTSGSPLRREGTVEPHSLVLGCLKSHILPKEKPFFFPSEILNSEKERGMYIKNKATAWKKLPSVLCLRLGETNVKNA